MTDLSRGAVFSSWFSSCRRAAAKIVVDVIP